MDDDNYLNPEALLSLLSHFPQDGDVYVGKPSLDKPIIAHELMDGNKTVPKQLNPPDDESEAECNIRLCRVKI